uniref:Putative guanine nucleotide exchange factor for rho and rac gtpase n=2 Tax=Anopheles triannulatus TaxID=58253 RepID=A0A2M4ANF3_9DIPT
MRAIRAVATSSPLAATPAPLATAAGVMAVAELHQVIEEPGVPEVCEPPPTVAEVIAGEAEVAQEAMESVGVLREVKSSRSSRRSMAPRVTSHREHRSTTMSDEVYYYSDDEFDSTGDEEEEEMVDEEQRKADVGGRGNVQGELAARADDFGENESNAPLLDDTSVPEAHNPQLVSSEHRGKPQYDEEDEFSSSSFDSDSDDEPFASSGYVRPDSDSSLKTSRVKSILQELLQNEANYVQTLGRGIENYVGIMGSKELPPGLRGQRYHIFGNIEKIHSLHRDKFLPMLERNQASIQGIAETFIRFLEHDKFYCYIMFALNRPKSERICNRNLDFFQRRQTDVDDKLGLNSFLLQPIQRLPRYKLLLAEINKEILKQTDEMLLEAVKGEIGVLCKAEKRLERFIDIVNEAMSINDIQECYEERKCVQSELMNAYALTLNIFSQVAHAPMVLMLRPYTDRNPDKQKPVNLFHQGKFRKMLEVDIYDWDQRRRYPAKMFLFERSVIYTEKGKTHLEYRGRYEYSEIGLYSESRNKVYLFARKRGIQEIEVHCSDMNEAQRLSNHVERMMTQFALREKERLRNMGPRVELPGRIPSVITLQHHRRSDMSILSTASSIGSARESYESASQTTWYVPL